MKISFCTTCMNRLEHLQETLPQNLADNPNVEGLDVEFVVLNYGDKEGMHEWMMTDPIIQEEIAAGRIVYARTDQDVFRMAHAKNMAHRLASGDIVCNLDADNFTGRGFARALAQKFQKDMGIVISPSFAVSRDFEPADRGFVGRIAINNGIFHALGGYRERFEGWGGEDNDFTRRAKMAKLEHLRFDRKEFLRVIEHPHEDRVKNMYQDVVDRDAALNKILEIKESGALKAVFNAGQSRIKTLINPVIANARNGHGVGGVTLFSAGDYVGEQYYLAPANRDSDIAFERISGVLKVVMGRLNPQITPLEGPGVEKS